MALLNSDKNVIISDDFVRNNLKIICSLNVRKGTDQATCSLNVRKGPDQAKHLQFNKNITCKL